MQTVASLAERLDMSAETALEKLQYMLFEVESVDATITDEQVDLLIDIDDEPGRAEEVRQAKLDEIEKEKKRLKKLHEASLKSAAKRKAAAKKKTAKKKTTTKKKAATKKKTTTKKKAKAKEKAEVDDTAATEEAEPIEVVEVTETAEVQEAPETTVEEAPPVEPAEETLPQAAEEPTEVPEPTEAETAAPDTSSHYAEILPPETEEEKEAKLREKADKKAAKEAAAAAEKARREEEAAREAAERERPLPVPDPAVVAAVIRKAEERKREKETPKRASGRKSGAKGAPAASIGEIGPPPPTPEEMAESGKKRRGKEKKRKKDRGRNEDLLRREAALAVREFQTGSPVGGKRRKKRKRQTDDGEDSTAEMQVRIQRVEMEDAITVEDLANSAGVGTNELILALMDMDVMATKNDMLSIDVVRQLGESLGFEVEAVIPEEEDLMVETPDKPEDLEPRAPVITVMGHVDHGKTSFLDAVREAKVAEGEAGGITQHIAAYDVSMDSGRVVFLDTPGHEAFTAMRARGAQATDVVVLVVAADDGIMPQTVEAIDHAKAAGVPIIVAVNKCDKPDAQPERVRQELTQHGLVAEEWGGDTIMRNISAKTHEGIPELLEMLALEAEMLELKANPNKLARGIIIESEINRGLGPVAWVLVQSGTLHVGDSFLAGECYGRVRTMHDSRGQVVEEAGPAVPVAVTGFNAPPEPGDIFVAVEDERIARAVAEKRSDLTRKKQGQGARHITLEDFHEALMAGEKQELNILVKTDVQGSVDVLKSSFSKLGNEEVRVNIVHSGVGGINESDVLLADASDAVIIGFHVSANVKARKQAEEQGVDIRIYNVIYEAIDDVKRALEGLLAPEMKESIIGHAEIRAVFRSSQLGNIAGCYVLDGVVERDAKVRLLRNDVVVYEGQLASLRREKDDAKTVQSGFECGIKLVRYEDIKEGDIIEIVRIEEVAKKLD